jgi:hypothetical protein
MRNFRLTATTLLTAALLVPAGTAFAANSHVKTTANTPAVSSALQKNNAQNEKIAKQLMGNTKYTPVIRTFTPKPTSTKGFTGYEQIIVKSPKGTTPVAGYFKLANAQQSSVIVTSAKVDLKQNAYVINLKFPGEQGNPGKLIVTTVSR